MVDYTHAHTQKRPYPTRSVWLTVFVCSLLVVCVDTCLMFAPRHFKVLLSNHLRNQHLLPFTFSLFFCTNVSLHLLTQMLTELILSPQARLCKCAQWQPLLWLNALEWCPPFQCDNLVESSHLHGWQNYFIKLDRGRGENIVLVLCGNVDKAQLINTVN